MCGICGIKGFKDDNLLKRMSAVMSHRGPDDQGYFLGKDIGLGIRRLSIIDLETGHQPIHNEDESIQVVLNGEIYNYRQLSQELKAKGHCFYTSSDTEVLAHLYEEFKHDCIHKLRGMFAFCIWDKKEDSLFLARDRLGIKPLYYTVKEDKFLFASEIKALLEYKDISREIDLRALDYYLSFLYIPAPLTIFKAIKKLSAGHYLNFKKGNLDIKRYWRLNVEQENGKSLGFYKEKINNALLDSVKSHLVSDVPLGVFLSGGIDSSAIVCLMNRLGINDIKTFSIGYEGRYASYNELEYSRLVAKKFNTQHREFIVKPDIINSLHNIIAHLDEPFADSSAVLTYFISRQASKHVKVALSGIGADELLGGYPRYIGTELSSYYDRLPYFFRKLSKGLSLYMKATGKGRDYAGRIKRFLASGMLDPYERYLSWITFFDKEKKDEIYSPDIKAAIKQTEYLHLNFFKEADRQGFLEQSVYLDINTYLPDDLLIMGDRMSMANSLELRVPFCDHELIKTCFAIPYKLKLKGFKLKGLFKETLEGILPAEVINKPKQGFMAPLADWLKQDLKPYALDVLSRDNIRKRGYFDPDYIQGMLRQHFSGKAIFTHQIWALLILELWLRTKES